MSTVKADNFTWKSGQSGGLTGTNVTGDQIVYGVSKSWINYVGSTQTVNRSFNVSSVTKTSTGTYNNNMTVSTINSNICVVSQMVRSATWVSSGTQCASFTTTYYQIQVAENGTSIDPPGLTASVYC